jgi:hypothetical protein
MIRFNRSLQGLAVALTSLVWSALAFAQDPTSTTNGSTTTTSTSVAWYGNWWVWAVGVAVFLVVVIALTNRGGRSNV